MCVVTLTVAEWTDHYQSLCAGGVTAHVNVGRRSSMANTRDHDPSARPPGSSMAQRRMALFAGATAIGVVVAAALFFRFPNLRGNPQNLALVLLTPLFCGTAVGLWISRVGRALPGLPRLVAPLLYSFTALLLLLDVAVYAGPLVIRGNQGTDVAPAFVGTTQPTQTTHVPDSATPSVAPAPAARQGTFDHRPGVDTAAGTAILGVTGDGTPLLRLENLQSANGPDLHVYLVRVTSPQTSQQVMAGLEVGTLKATTGDTNYPLPAGTDLSQFKSVVIYCKSFSVIFGFANLG